MHLCGVPFMIGYAADKFGVTALRRIHGGQTTAGCVCLCLQQSDFFFHYLVHYLAQIKTIPQ